MCWHPRYLARPALLPVLRGFLAPPGGLPILWSASAFSGSAIAWMAIILLVPLFGPILYYVVGRSPIPRSLRTMLVAGALGIYVVIAALAVVIGGS